MFASVLAAPQDREGKWLGAHHAVVGAHPAVVNAHPVVGAAQVVNVAHHTVAAPRVGTAPLQIAAPLPAPHLTQQKLPDQTVVHKPQPIITKKVHLGQTTYVSGYATQILKPAIPDFKIAGNSFICLFYLFAWVATSCSWFLNAQEADPWEPSQLVAQQDHF